MTGLVEALFWWEAWGPGPPAPPPPLKSGHGGRSSYSLHLRNATATLAVYSFQHDCRPVNIFEGNLLPSFTFRSTILCLFRRESHSFAKGMLEVPAAESVGGVRSTSVDILILTSCARGETICPSPSPPPWAPKRLASRPSRPNVALLSHAEYVPTLTAAAASRVKAALSKAACSSHALDVGYLCANFGLPGPLCSRLRPDVRNRQTDRQTSDKSIA